MTAGPQLRREEDVATTNPGGKKTTGLQTATERRLGDYEPWRKEDDGTTVEEDGTPTKVGRRRHHSGKKTAVPRREEDRTPTKVGRRRRDHGEKKSTGLWSKRHEEDDGTTAGRRRDTNQGGKKTTALRRKEYDGITAKENGIPS
ncbi:unnamed protein product [Acanthoscelides obtectus]|uniref:Uncharacterized protein n=1 Tax=Acanthoscelides obtectus TaxID=200917 RepID=A0A9P0P142_ACAOB|nr:unnamed protein product [Acanthoscelides obtectus]CAK1658737.1 hypothetical protein AOBTE_LOCUS21095 [Acanthoscelides obtectus]